MKINTIFFRTFVQRFFEDLVTVRAASLAFTTLLSIVPLMIFIFYLLSFFPILSQAGQLLEAFVITHFVASSASSILKESSLFIANTEHLSWLNIAALAFISFWLIFNVVDAINGVWRVKMNTASFLSLILHWIVFSLLPIIFGFLLAVSTSMKYVTSLWWVFEWMLFSCFHWAMPSCKVQWRYAMAAGFVTTAAFECTKYGFVEYVHHFSNYQIIYGALASIPVFFVWIFLSWLIIIAGALLCHLLQQGSLKEK